MARVSDLNDRLTLILTEGGSVVVELAKDPKQSIREALEGLRAARSEEEGALSAFLIRAGARLLGRLLRRSPASFDVERELPLDSISLRYRRGALLVRTPGGDLTLIGAVREDAERFMREARRLTAER